MRLQTHVKRDREPDLEQAAEQPPARMVAGALAHLARHMETGCPRAAYLAAMLLEKVANDPEADAHLRRHAHELVDILDRDDESTEIAMPPRGHNLHEPARRI